MSLSPVIRAEVKQCSIGPWKWVYVLFKSNEDILRLIDALHDLLKDNSSEDDHIHIIDYEINENVANSKSSMEILLHPPKFAASDHYTEIELDSWDD